jgi:hypothetical protein
VELFRCEFCDFRAEEYAEKCVGCGHKRPGGRYGTLVIRRPHTAASANHRAQVFFDGEDHIPHDLHNGGEVTQGLEVGGHQVEIRARGALPGFALVEIWPGGTHTYQMSFSALGGLDFQVVLELVEVSLPGAFPAE